MAGVDRFLQDLARKLRTAHVEHNVIAERERIAQILERILGRKRALRKLAGDDRLQAMIAQPE